MVRGSIMSLLSHKFYSQRAIFLVFFVLALPVLLLPLGLSPLIAAILIGAANFALILQRCVSVGFSRDTTLFVLITSCFYVYCWFTFSLGFSDLAIGRFATLFVFLGSMTFFALSFDTHLARDSARQLVSLTTLVVVVCIVFNIGKILTDPTLIIRMNYSDAGASEYRFIANTMLASAWSFLLLIVIVAAPYSSVVKFTLTLLVLSYALMAAKTTMLLLLVLSLLIRFLSKSGVILIFLSLFIAAIGVDVIFNEGLAYVDYISVRLTALYNFVTAGEFSSELERVRLAGLSLSTFLANPIFGVGYDFVSLEGGLNAAYESGIGHHSEAIDFLARFGLFGVLTASVIVLFIRRSGLMAELNGRVGASIVFYLVGYSLLNNFVSAGMGFVLFFFLPIINRINTEPQK